MRRLMVIGSLAGLWLAGCAQPVPDSSAMGAGAGAGVGFGDYAAYELERARREAQLTGAAPGTVAGYPAPVPATPYGAAPSGISAGDLAAVGIGAAPPPVTSGPIGGGVPPAIAGATPVPGALPPATTIAPTTPAAAPLAGPGEAPLAATLSAADPGGAAAASAGAAIYGEGRLGAGQIAPGALPPTSAARPEWSPQADPLRDTGLEAQPGNAAPVLVNAPAVAPVADAGPNIVAYALSAPNQVGQEWYSRFAFAREGRMQRNCADYRSADEAQSDFLARGGPERDARGLDPDGDGFACGWDPAPFRAAVNG
jgi:hypothetical protein